MSYRAPKGWTNEGQKRGCLALHPASDRAKVISMEEKNSALTGTIADLMSRIEALESAPAPRSSKKK